MANIHILPEQLSNRIAAGEVVERPASVVKELVENSIDAGASMIEVEIEKAGSRLIAVRDNGSGMDETDALLSFSPHATSKIQTLEDIEGICTLGFRGEALPSIAAVSRLTLKTRTAAALAGVEFFLQGGKLIRQSPAGCAVGTQISVRDLFFNVPARKKFLRSDATEEAHLQETVIMLALGFPGVGFRLKIDGRIVFNSPAGGTLRPRLTALFGKSYVERMLPVQYKTENLILTGCVAQIGFSRNTRKEQRTFVNGRMVESQAIYRGIRDGYGTLADFGRYAPVVLFLEMDPREFDINVHPTKREVRFSHEFTISRAVTEAVRSALENAPTPQLLNQEKLPSIATLLAGAKVDYQPPPVTPELWSAAPEPAVAQKSPDETTPPPPAEAREATEVAGNTTNTTNPKSEEIPSASASASPTVAPVLPVESDATSDQPSPPEMLHQASQLLGGSLDQAHAMTERNATREWMLIKHSKDLRFLGVTLGTFLVVEAVPEATLLLIDFHAAHERVLYEQLLHRATQAEAEGVPVPMQQLLLPQTLELGRMQAAWLSKHHTLFARLGFEIAQLSSNTVMLCAIPSILPDSADLERILLDTVQELLQAEKGVASLTAIARAACHAAVKAHDKIDAVSANALLESMKRCDRPDVCPHGRPTMLQMPLPELQRKFGRI